MAGSRHFVYMRCHHPSLPSDLRMMLSLGQDYLRSGLLFPRGLLEVLRFIEELLTVLPTIPQLRDRLAI